MSYRIFGYLPFLAAALGVPAAAQAGSAACTGDGIMADNGAERGTTIIRSGSGHTATVTRTDPDGTIHLEQHGEDHAAVTVQSGSGGRLVIDQRGASA